MIIKSSVKGVKIYFYSELSYVPSNKLPNPNNKIKQKRGIIGHVKLKKTISVDWSCNCFFIKIFQSAHSRIDAQTINSIYIKSSKEVV